MATINGSNIQASSITFNKNNTGNGTITWTNPTLPAGATITKCVLSGSFTGPRQVSVTINGTKFSLSGNNTTSDFAVEITSENATSVDTSATGKTAGTVSFSNLVYTVTYSLSHTVTFVDWDGTVLETQQVEQGTSATAPSNPTRDGYRFTGWDIDFSNVTSDLTVTAQYVEIIYYTVTFKDWDGTVLKTETVEEGTNATPPSNPSREGYTFNGWDGSYTNINSDTIITATYIEDKPVVKTLVAKYTANAAGVVPKFNSGYTYEVSETENNGIYTVEITSDSDFSSCSFNGKTNLLTVEYLKITNIVTSTYQLFYGCTSLTSIKDMSNWDISNVTTMFSMFYNCNNLTTLDVSSFNTSNVTKIAWMFYNCSSLTELDLSNFNTSKVTNMSYMFSDCSNLTTLNINSFNTSNVTDMSYMFSDCSNLISISMNNSDYNSVNKIISQLPTRTADSMGALYIAGVDDISQVDTAAAQSKCWNVVDKLLVAKYTARIAGVVPTFNDGYVYELTETENNGIYTVEITSDTDFTSIDFKSKTGLLTVEYLKITNTVTSMHQLFDGCTYLASINGMADWDTSNVTDMAYIFRNCYELTSLDVSNFNTSKVTNMNNMFTSCNLTELNLSNFNTTNVTDMRYMFQNCSSLTTLDVSSFNTSNATAMNRMFHNCQSLTSLDVSNFNTSKVTDMTNMFYNCNKLTTLDVGNFDTSKVTTMISMFQNCTGLTSLNISNWNLTNVSNASDMFSDCTSLTSISMYESDYNSVNKIIAQLSTRTADSMGTLNIVGVDDISQVDTATAQSKFWNISDKLLVAKYTANASGVVPTFNVDFQYRVEEINNGDGTYTSKVFCKENSTFTSCSFKELTSLLTVDYLDITTKVSNMGAMFLRCSNLTEINTEGWDTSNVTNMREMFAYCSSLENIDTSNLTVKSHVTLMNDMFYNCKKITSLDVNHFDVSGVSDMNEMFTNCSALTSLDLSSWNINNVTDMNYLFKNCVSLTQLNISTWNLSSVTYSNMMFDSCSELKLITMRNSDYGSINKIISNLWSFKEGAEATLDIIGVDDYSQVDIATAQSKFWNVVEESEDDVIEWTGIGTIATGLRAHDVEHSNYKINIDWDTQYFDIIVTEEFNYLYESIKNVNIALLDKIKIGNNIYEATLFVTDNIDISIYGPMDEAPNYTIERNYPYTIRLAKEGIYVLYGTTSHLIMERDYDLDTIYFNEDGRDNKPLSNTENGDYDVAFDLVVSERPNEEPDDNELVQGDINNDGTFDDESTTVVRTKYIDISDKKSIQVNVLTDDVYISACYLYNANKELVKVIEIPAGKERKFGVNLYELIAQIIKDEGCDQ